VVAFDTHAGTLAEAVKIGAEAAKGPSEVSLDLMAPTREY
jgi:hypothetical protein